MKAANVMECDVAIVGGGPAGSTAARALAKAGLSVILIEKCRYPRLKPCGNLVSNYALSHLDIPLPSRLIRATARGAVVLYGPITARVETEPFGVFALRTDFDQFLAARAVEAGARLLEDTTVSGLELLPRADEARVRILTTRGASLTARYVVGADGGNSVVAKHVRRRPLRRYETAIGLMTLQPAADVPCRAPHDPESLLLDMNASPTGYGWAFPQGEQFNVGVAGWTPFFRTPKTSLASFLLKCGIRNPARSHGHILPVGASRHRLAVGPLFLTGDAAGLINVVSGEGIGYAILSGKLAASAILDARPGDGPEEAARRYTRQVSTQILRELRSAERIAALILAMRRVRFFLTPADTDEVFRALFAAVAGTARYTDLASLVYRRLPTYLAKWLWCLATKSGAAQSP